MTTAVRLRHTNRTGLRHLSATHARREEETAAFGYPQSARPRPLRRRRPSAVLETAEKQLARRRPGRHDLLPLGPGQALCTACGCVFELHVFVESDRRLPRCVS